MSGKDSVTLSPAQKIDKMINQSISICFQDENNNRLCIQPNEKDKSGDINGAEKVITFRTLYQIKDKPLKDVLKDKAGQKLTSILISYYGLKTEDIKNMIKAEEASERKVMYYITQLRFTDVVYKLSAIDKLEMMKHPLGFKALSKIAIYDPNPRVRIAALKALKSIDFKQAIPFLNTVKMNDPNESVKYSARSILEKGIELKVISMEDIGEAEVVKYEGIRFPTPVDHRDKYRRSYIQDIIDDFKYNPAFR